MTKKQLITGMRNETATWETVENNNTDSKPWIKIPIEKEQQLIDLLNELEAQANLKPLK